MCFSYFALMKKGPAFLTLRMGLSTRAFVILFLLLTCTLTHLHAFKLFASGSMTHDDITTAAILNTTADVCRALAEEEGRDFVLPVRGKQN